MEVVNLLVAYLQLGLNLGQVGLSCLDELVELVNMLAQDIFLVLQVPNVVLISAAVLPQVVDFFIKVEQFAALVPVLHLEAAQFTVWANLVGQGSSTVLNCLVYALGDAIDIGHLLLDIISHAIVLSACLLQTLP